MRVRGKTVVSLLTKGDFHESNLCRSGGAPDRLGLRGTRALTLNNQGECQVTNSALPNGYRRATGFFEVTMNPLPPYDTADGISLGRTTINKRFHGDLEATSVVEMIGAMTSVRGSAGYVAIERIVGTLAGRSGSFVLQHSGTMTRGEAQLTVSVVPDSGTGELKGISGKMAIDIVEGKHTFSLDFVLGGGP